MIPTIHLVTATVAIMARAIAPAAEDYHAGALSVSVYQWASSCMVLPLSLPSESTANVSQRRKLQLPWTIKNSPRASHRPSCMKTLWDSRSISLITMVPLLHCAKYLPILPPINGRPPCRLYISYSYSYHYHYSYSLVLCIIS